MPDTAQSVLQDALEKIKVYAPGVAINAADGARGLSVINKMLDSWSNERLICFANLEQSFPLQASKNAYTIGPSGGPDITAPRPLEILTGPGAAYLVDTNANRYPVDVITQEQWNQIGLLTQTSQLPDTLFYDPQFPLGIINIFPMPLIAYTMHFMARLQLADLANLTTAFSLPPGYIQAIVDNVGVKLWPYYKQGDPPGWLVEEARQSLGNIKRTNIKQSPAPYDSAIVSRAQSAYNIYNDSTNRSNG
jgi:hypothetical protein